MTKLCVVCGKSLVGSQRKLCSDRECHKERRKETVRKYYQNNWEKLRVYNRERYQNNLEKERGRSRECSRKHRLKNSEKIAEYKRKYRHNNQEKIAKYRCEYHRKNREKLNNYNREYRQNNCEKLKESNHKYYYSNQEKKRENRRKYYRRTRGLPEDCDLSHPSSIELIMKQWLQDSSIEFTEQQYINLRAFGANWTRVDFFIEPNICLYSDGGIGTYYHGTKDVQERDDRINKALEEGGHIVIRLSESDILTGVRPVEILELI